MDTQWVDRMSRMAAANARAERERLQALTLEESLRQFEAWCEEVEALWPERVPHRTHPVGVIKYWKKP